MESAFDSALDARVSLLDVASRMTLPPIGLKDGIIPLLLIAGLLILIGIRSFKKMDGVAPKQTIESVHQDTEALKGLGRYDN